MIFTYFDICFSFLPVIAFFAYWRFSKSNRSIVLIVVYSFLFFAINLILSIGSRIPLLYDFFTLVEFLVFSSFIYLHLKNQTSKKLLQIACIVFTLFYILFTLYTKGGASISSLTQNEVAIDSVPIGVETIIVLAFSFYFLYERTNDTTTLFIYNTYQFWVVLGMVLYLAGSFFIYIFANFLSPAEVFKYWVITNVFSILRSCFFTLAIIYHAKPTKNKLVSDFGISYLN